MPETSATKPLIERLLSPSADVRKQEAASALLMTVRHERKGPRRAQCV